MLELGLACDGGKDSLSMAASAGGETVMAPGNLVVSAYVGCPDITFTVRLLHRMSTVTVTSSHAPINLDEYYDSSLMRLPHVNCNLKIQMCCYTWPMQAGQAHSEGADAKG